MLREPNWNEESWFSALKVRAFVHTIRLFAAYDGVDVVAHTMMSRRERGRREYADN